MRDRLTVLSHKIELRPTPSQVLKLSRAAGCARFAWNWGLAEWNRRYEESLTNPDRRRPNIVDIKKEWSQVKHSAFPWLSESPANANLQPFDHLGIAFKRFFQKKAGHQRFKKKGRHDSFYIDNQKMKLTDTLVRLPKIGAVRLTEPLRLTARSCAVSFPEKLTDGSCQCPSTCRMLPDRGLVTRPSVWIWASPVSLCSPPGRRSSTRMRLLDI